MAAAPASTATSRTPDVAGNSSLMPSCAASSLRRHGYPGRTTRPPPRRARDTALIRKMTDLSAASLNHRTEHQADEQLRQHDGEIEDPHEESHPGFVHLLGHDRERERHDGRPPDADHRHQRVEAMGRRAEEHNPEVAQRHDRHGRHVHPHAAEPFRERFQHRRRKEESHGVQDGERDRDDCPDCRRGRGRVRGRASFCWMKAMM